MTPMTCSDPSQVHSDTAQLRRRNHSSIQLRHTDVNVGLAVNAPGGRR